MAEGRFTNPVTATLAGIKDFFAKQELAHRYSDRDRADHLTILITGANSGLGFALAVAFAKRGGKVIMAGRSKIPEAGDRVKKLSGSDKVEMRYLDLSNIGSIHLFVPCHIDPVIIEEVLIKIAGFRRSFQNTLHLE